MKSKLFIFALASFQFLLSEKNDMHDKSFYLNRQPPLYEEYCSLPALNKNDSTIIFIPITQEESHSSTSKNNEKLHNQLEQLKKLTCQSSISAAFIFLIKTIGNPQENLASEIFLIAGKIFCLISTWEAAKTGYKVLHYWRKRERQRYTALSLMQEIEKYDNNVDIILGKIDD